jgi:hypothetical protein
MGKGEKRMLKSKLIYKCTYTSLEGARCPVMGGFKQPHPSHCHAYDTAIWKINPEKTCANCIPLEPGEIPKKKIWCDQMDRCDSYNDGGIEQCEDCIAATVVFDAPKGKVKNRMTKTKTYTVYYTKTTNGQIEVEASSQEEASQKVENGDVSFGSAREYDDPIDVYSVE